MHGDLPAAPPSVLRRRVLDFGCKVHLTLTAGFHLLGPAVTLYDEVFRPGSGTPAANIWSSCYPPLSISLRRAATRRRQACLRPRQGIAPSIQWRPTKAAIGWPASPRGLGCQRRFRDREACRGKSFGGLPAAKHGVRVIGYCICHQWHSFVRDRWRLIAVQSGRLRRRDKFGCYCFRILRRARRSAIPSLPSHFSKACRVAPMRLRSSARSSLRSFGITTCCIQSGANCFA